MQKENGRAHTLQTKNTGYSYKPCIFTTKLTNTIFKGVYEVEGWYVVADWLLKVNFIKCLDIALCGTETPCMVPVGKYEIKKLSTAFYHNNLNNGSP